jgi:hypothetical protein
MNSKDLLKEIQMQQQRLSTKTMQNLFSTIETGDIGMRTKTEGHVKSMQTFESNVDLDPYSILQDP